MRIVALFLSSILLAAPAAARERLELHLTRLDLPGRPAALLPVDLDGDGIRDLVAVIVYTEWDQIGIEEKTEMDDVEGLVEVLTIVPALFDRREIHFFRGLEAGGYEAAAPSLEIDKTVLTLAAGGPPEWPVVALVDEGISALHLDPATSALSLVPLAEERSLLARTESFLPGLELIHDLDGDGRGDVLLPTRAGAAVYLGAAEGPRLGGRLAYLADPPAPPVRNSFWIEYAVPRGVTRPRYQHPLPEVRDATGDGRPDLLLPHPKTGWEHLQILENLGEGRFAAPRTPLGAYDPDAPRDDGGEEGKERMVHFGDLDGDGIGEYVTAEDLGAADGGLRKELKEARRPPFRYRFYRAGPDLGRQGEPYMEIEAQGYAFGIEDDQDLVPGGFQDLDGDGRHDLVALTLDFSIFQAIRIIAARSINIGLDFHLWCQADDGSFQPVEDLDLSGRFRLDLDNLRLGSLSQFKGDFDGDGRVDFVQLGRGREVTIHLGQEDCRFAAAPDLLLRLDEAPRNLELVKIADYDGDGLSDLAILEPILPAAKERESGVTAPVRLDLYTSGGEE